MCLLELLSLNEQYKVAGRVRDIGFSGHHNGIAIDIVVVLMGATIIERHFTLDRAWKGSDHAPSLGPDGFARLTRDVSHLRIGWTFKDEDVLAVERAQREKLKYRTRNGHGAVSRTRMRIAQGT